MSTPKLHWRSLREFRQRSRVSGHVLATAFLMIGLYAVLYQPYSTDGVPGSALQWYLSQIANLSSLCLNLGGEQTHVEGTAVLGRFPLAVVVDCAALDAQALFAAAVIAFPVVSWKRLWGLLLGLPAIFLLNVARLVALYHAGISSIDLFHWLHEEVFVIGVVLMVCAMFAVWAIWAERPSPSGIAGVEVRGEAM